MGKLRSYFSSLIASLGRSARRYPVTIALSAALTALIIGIIHSEYQNDILNAWVMTASLGIAASLCVRAAAETFSLSGRVQAAMYVGLAVLLALYRIWLAVPDNLVAGIRLAALIAALGLLFIALPFIRRSSERPVELYAIRLAYRALITGIYTGVLIGGLSAILLAMDELLGVRLPDHIYEDVSTLVSGLFAPIFFLAGVPEPGEELPITRYPAFIRVLLLYVLVPLLGAYGLVLYIYFIKMLVTLTWPVNMLGHMVFWYSLIGVGVLFLLWPLRERSAWARVYCAWYPRIGILPLIMMFISLGIRIAAYGITETRYIVWVVGMWLLAALIVRAVRRQGAGVWMPVTLAAVAFLMVMGPWSAFSVSRMSQNARLNALLARSGMLVSGKAVPAAADAVSQRDREEIADILRYFDRTHSLSDVAAMPEGFALDDAEKTLGFAITEWGPVGEKPYQYFYSAGEYAPLTSVAGYDYYYSNIGGKADSEAGTDELSVRYDPSAQSLTLASGGNTLIAIDISQHVRQILGRYPGLREIPEEEMVFEEANEQVRVQIVYEHVGYRGDIVEDAAFHALIDIR